MIDYKEWFNNVKDVSPLGNCIVYRQTKLERLLANILPHIIPFISKRRRVAIRSYWKHRYARRASIALCKLLMKQKYSPLHVMSDFTNELYEWEIINEKKCTI